MEKINIGQEVELQFGGRARVSGVIGAGSHDTVYLAEYNGMKWALKWYDTDKITDLDRFRSNIKNNMADGAPNNKFLWPRYFTKETEKGSFGIMLECKPDSFEPMRDLLRGYKKIIEPDTGKITKKKVRFSSLHAMVTAGINIIHGFRQLHRFGKCYHQMSRNSFFINPDTGAVLIGGCDNIAPVGSELVLEGRPAYLAPEVNEGITLPDAETDKFTMAVILFQLLFRGDPFEGEKVVMDVCLSNDDLRRHYGRDAVFVFDPDNDTNRPVRGIHDGLMKFWDIYPDYVRNAFIKSFTAGLMNKEERLTEDDFQKIFIRLRSEIISCSCGKTDFMTLFDRPDIRTFKCPNCLMEFSTLSFSNFKNRVPLYIGKKFYECEIWPDSEDFLTVAGELVENKFRPGLLGIKNCSDKKWRAKMPDGVFHDIDPGKGFPIWPGLEIDFGAVIAKI
ncbi:MAG: serine/threonine protein kinase [Ruminococcus sp.]|nr:serine/threonine protein kinase [Ruminococcus sp.]